MHNMHLSNRGKLFKIGASRLETTVRTSVIEAIAKTVFMLAIVINVEVAKTKASFLTSRVENT